MLTYKRTYRWSDLAVKRREHNYSAFKYRTDRVFFSVHPVKKPVKLDPMYYCLFRHPFTCFFVYLVAGYELQELQKRQYSNYIKYTNFAVNRKVFMQKMEEWGVELTRE